MLKKKFFNVGFQDYSKNRRLSMARSYGRVTGSLDAQNFGRGFRKYISLAIRHVEFGDFLTREFWVSSDFEATGY
uniref:Uncharacterized protein n=1 Tax=Rhizophagus irregularis (strain DAOM 181602 / DAOM 197198 / MUCL 43194) TaxID=747089 RepID=U9UBF9_RHIID